MPREVGNWIDGFVKLTDETPAPEIWRRWSAYAAVSGALERKCWTTTVKSNLYPNLFIILVGEPGLGKSTALDPVHEFWSSVPDLCVAPVRLSDRGFFNRLAKKKRMATLPDGRTIIFHSMLAVISELGTFLTSHDTAFLNILNEIYDCREYPFEDETDKHGSIKIDRPHMCMLAGVATKYLGSILPDEAYGQGFTRRIILVYSSERKHTPIFTAAPVVAEHAKLKQRLKSDLRQIASLTGEFTWDKKAADAVDAWNKLAGEDGPKHPKLSGYLTTRVIHCVKMAMVMSAAESNDMKVTVKHFERAQRDILEAEAVMPEIFKEMSTSTDASEVDEAWEFIWGYTLNKKTTTVPEQALVNFLAKKVPLNKISYFINTMLTSNKMKLGSADIPGRRKFIPLSRERHGEEA